MIDPDSVEGFDWDDGNARKNDKHGVGQTETEEVFFNQPLLMLADAQHSAHELRFHALGNTNAGRGLHTTFTLRAQGALVRVISARDMHRKERIIYDQANQGDAAEIQERGSRARLLGGQGQGLDGIS